MRLTVESLDGRHYMALQLPSEWSLKKAHQFCRDLGMCNSTVFVGLSFDEFAPDVKPPVFPIRDEPIDVD